MQYYIPWVLSVNGPRHAKLVLGLHNWIAQNALRSFLYKSRTGFITFLSVEALAECKSKELLFKKPVD